MAKPAQKFKATMQQEFEFQAKPTSIIIPVFNQISFTKICLETLAADFLRPSLEVIIIDNGSTDGTSEYLQEVSRSWASDSANQSHGNDKVLKVISNSENRGVAPAWNQGLQASALDYIAILNNDLHLTTGWITGCQWALKHHQLALVSPYAATGELNYEVEARAKQFTAQNRKKLWRDYDFCCVMMPRSTYQAIGLFDENYLVGGYEDTDYSYRLRKAGLGFGVSGAAYIHHFGSQTLGGFKKRGDKHAAHNKNYFISKWGEDPSRFAGTWRGKILKSWRRFKMKYGSM